MVYGAESDIGIRYGTEHIVEGTWQFDSGRRQSEPGRGVEMHALALQGKLSNWPAVSAMQASCGSFVGDGF